MEPHQERHRAEGARSYPDQTTGHGQPATQQRPTQEEILARTREFGGEMNQIEGLTRQLATIVSTLVPVLEHIERIGANGKSQHHGRPSLSEGWSYGGIDTARDHKQLGEVIGRLELGILELQGAVLGFGPAMLRLETRIAHLSNRVEFALSQMQQAA